MRKYILILLIFTIPAVLLAACSPSNSDPAAKAVEEYFKALVTRDADRLQNLVCPDWEDQALLALDSLEGYAAAGLAMFATVIIRRLQELG